MKRRDFLLNASLTLAAAGMASANASSLGSLDSSTMKSAKIRFGVISDLHQDITFDAPQRLQAFIEEMNQLKPDFILELGDFCCPVESNKVIADIWEGFHGPNYHVIGNHELDKNCTREQVVSFWGMPGRYYSFDRNGLHFIVLDGNGDPKLPKPSWGYWAGIDGEQLEWLSADLAGTQLPTIVFCHQGFDNCAMNIRVSVRTLLENTRVRNGNGRVVAVFSGHFHQDYYNFINGIHYVEINSANFYWCGSTIYNNSFAPAAVRVHPQIQHMAFYRDPLWAFVEVSHDGILEVRGKKTEWLGKTPQDLNRVFHEWDYPAVPSVSSRKLRL